MIDVGPAADPPPKKKKLWNERKPFPHELACC
jgi:hypothetical protein